MIAGLLAGFLPQLVLRLFYSLMPTILALLERCGGLPAESEVEWGVVRKYFSFQVRASPGFFELHRGTLALPGDTASLLCFILSAKHWPLRIPDTWGELTTEQ